MKTMMLISLCAMTMLCGCNEDKICLKGSGNVETYVLPEASIESVTLIGPINLMINQGVDERIELLCEPKVFHELEYDIRKNRLEIGFEDNVRCLENIEEVWVHLWTKDLKKLNVSGQSTIENTEELLLEKLDITVEGIADIQLSGEVSSQEISVDGMASIRNRKLMVGSSKVTIRGSADINLSCENELDINVEGQGTIRYWGSPRIKQEVKGQLQLIRM